MSIRERIPQPSSPHRKLITQFTRGSRNTSVLPTGDGGTNLWPDSSLPYPHPHAVQAPLLCLSPPPHGVDGPGPTYCHWRRGQGGPCSYLNSLPVKTALDRKIRAFIPADCVDMRLLFFKSLTPYGTIF